MRSEIEKLNQRPHFDEHAFQFAKPNQLEKLNHSDVSRMHFMPRKVHPKRRLPTPLWALNDEQTRQVLVTYLERRYYLVPKGSLVERLERCKRLGSWYGRRLKRVINGRIEEFRAVAKKNYTDLPRKSYEKLFLSALAGASPEEFAERLSAHITQRDGEAFAAARCAELALAVVYYFYRLGWDSPTVASELGLRAPHVRQICARMNRAARRIRLL